MRRTYLYAAMNEDAAQRRRWRAPDHYPPPIEAVSQGNSWFDKLTMTVKNQWVSRHPERFEGCMLIATQSHRRVRLISLSPAKRDFLRSRQDRNTLMWEVLKTAQAVSKKSRLVKIDQQALVNFSEKLSAEKIAVPSWNDFYHFYGTKEETIAYLLILDSINFCFWPALGNPKWEFDYQSEKLSGYFALAASLKKALESGIPLTNAQYLAELSPKEFKKILGGTGDLQLLKFRVRSLNELGRLLIRDYRGQAYAFVEAAAQSALKLARLLAEKLPSFRDTAEYHGKKVFFYKRAQLFAADLYGTLQGKGLGSFHDLDQLTAFADYKVPQVLRHLRVIRYEKALAQKIDLHILLDAGSPEEVEIRANTIWVVERIRQELLARGKNLKAMEIDWILWNLGQQDAYRVHPYHRTLTIFY